ncbi:MAG: hypothetical protein HC789_04545 [Microcoleus sp. CSU_2_2]|nr:hypothetical protein [Microcoleus sp. CSU_2_2]
MRRSLMVDFSLGWLVATHPTTNRARTLGTSFFLISVTSVIKSVAELPSAI